MSYESASGHTIALGVGRLTVVRARGLEAPPLSTTVATGPALEGAILATGRIEPRIISVEVLLNLSGLDLAGMIDARNQLSLAMGLTEAFGALNVTRAGRTRRIAAKPLREPSFAPRRWNEAWQTLILEFVCGQIAFEDTEEETYDLSFYLSRLEFSDEGIEFPDEGVATASTETTRERTTTIVNRGNQPAPVRIRFTGPFLNPFLRNVTTGETIRIAQGLYEGEYLEIDTTPGHRSIRIVQQDTNRNGMHYLDLSSSFWMLAPGENRIEIGDESPGEGSEACFAFTSHYLEA